MFLFQYWIHIWTGSHRTRACREHVAWGLDNVTLSPQCQFWSIPWSLSCFPSHTLQSFQAYCTFVVLKSWSQNCHTCKGKGRSTLSTYRLTHCACLQKFYWNSTSCVSSEPIQRNSRIFWEAFLLRVWGTKSRKSIWHTSSNSWLLGPSHFWHAWYCNA